MKLCSCNKCNGIFEDMNPQTGAPEFDIKQHTDLPALVHCYDKDDVEQIVIYQIMLMWKS